MTEKQTTVANIDDSTGMETSFIECACHTSEHLIKVVYDPEDNEMFVEVHLHTWKSIFRRMWVAIKYVFGYKTRFGQWDELIVQPKDYKRLADIFNRAHVEHFKREIDDQARRKNLQ